MKNTVDLVFEIGCEEIPAGMLPGAAEELKGILDKYLVAQNLISEPSIETFGAPRRLAATCSAVLEKQPDEVKEVTGPPKAVAFDANGKPTRAAESFAQKVGLAVQHLTLIETSRGPYLSAKQVIPGRTSQIILEEILPRAVAEISWQRSMYWTSATGIRFIRPIRWVVALLGGKKLRFTLGDAVAGDSSAGHRFLGEPKIVITGEKDYAQKLKANFVLVNPADRRKKIETEMHRLASAKNLRIHEDSHLLDLVTYLNEYPTAIMGSFDPSFLELPEEILITVMRDHQKYFALEKKNGNLAPHFLAIINLDKDREGLIRAGHERVLRARFADARFFWETDQKCRLADNLPKLGAVTYQTKLGSYGQKVERVRTLSRWLADLWFSSGIVQASVGAADRAAELAKCDLVSEMVGEFTELQGVVGGRYAEAQGEPEEVAWAVYDHYKPASLDEEIPRNITGRAVALADKLDTLVGCFTVGLIPTGSSDPFALRRAAMGIVRIIVESKLPLSLSVTITKATRTLTETSPNLQVSPEAESKVMDFILERARFVLKERDGFAYDEINAAFSVSADDLVDTIKRIDAIKAIRKSKNIEPLAVSFKRIRKIIEKAGPESEWRLPTVRVDLLAEVAERDLNSEAQVVVEATEQLKRQGKYKEALQGIAGLRPAIDRFFEEVMVNAEDPEIRRNRLTLLAGLLSEFSTIADFAELAPADK